MTKNKKIAISLISICAVLVVLLVVLLCVFLIDRPSIELTDVEAQAVGDADAIRVKWDASRMPDKVEIQMSIASEGANSFKIENGTDIAKGYYDVNGYYGKNKIKVIAHYKSASSSKEVEVNRYADEYVIAPLIATAPVSIFTLKLKEISNNYTIPTFVWLQRGAAWDYAEMPENVYLIPNAQISDIANGGLMYGNTAAWVKELYSIHPESKFHFYFNDYWPSGWIDTTYGINLPKEKYDVTLLTDGTASASAFANNFADPATFNANYTELATQYNDYVAAVKEGRSYDLPHRISDYVLCMLKEEPNVKLWLLRDWISLPGAGVEANVVQSEIMALKESGKITNVNLNGLLTALSADEQAALKKLYKFSDDMFEKAKKENKKVMVILGTSPSGEVDFDAYVKATMAFYGDGYVYYYKGHPGYPVAQYPERLENREKLGLIDVESSIAAELIFFFNPDVVTSGYSSTTFESLRDDQVGGIFNTNLDGVSNVYSDKVDFAIFKADAQDEKYKSFANGHSFVIEVKDATKYEFAIYDEQTNQLKYFKTQSGNFTEVTL